MTHRDRGSAGVETAIAVTALLAMAFLIIGGIRVISSGSDVNAAARAGARAAAAEYTASGAQAAATTVVTAVLTGRGVACTGLSVAIGGDLAAGSTVSVDVTCTVSLADVVLAGFPGSRTVTGSGVEYVDAVRGGT